MSVKGLTTAGGQTHPKDTENSAWYAWGGGPEAVPIPPSWTGETHNNPQSIK